MIFGVRIDEVRGCVPTVGGIVCVLSCGDVEMQNRKMCTYTVSDVGTYPRYVRKSKAAEARGFHSFPPAQDPKSVAPPLLRNREGAGHRPLRASKEKSFEAFFISERERKYVGWKSLAVPLRTHPRCVLTVGDCLCVVVR